MTHPNLEKIAEEVHINCMHLGSRVGLCFACTVTVLRQVREQTVEECAKEAEKARLVGNDEWIYANGQYTASGLLTYANNLIRSRREEIAKAIRQLAQDNGKE